MGHLVLKAVVVRSQAGAWLRWRIYKTGTRGRGTLVVDHDGRDGALWNRRAMATVAVVHESRAVHVGKLIPRELAQRGECVVHVAESVHRGREPIGDERKVAQRCVDSVHLWVLMTSQACWVWNTGPAGWCRWWYRLTLSEPSEVMVRAEGCCRERDGVVSAVEVNVIAMRARGGVAAVVAPLTRGCVGSGSRGGLLVDGSHRWRLCDG